MHTLLRLTALTAFALTSSVAFAQARLQVIHNAADPGAAVVDVYVNGGILLDDFAFRAATPYIDVASDTDLEIAVAPGTSAYRARERSRSLTTSNRVISMPSAEKACPPSPTTSAHRGPAGRTRSCRRCAGPRLC